MYQASQKDSQDASNGAEVKTDTTESTGVNSKEKEVEDADFEVVEDAK